MPKPNPLEGFNPTKQQRYKARMLAAGFIQGNVGWVTPKEKQLLQAYLKELRSSWLFIPNDD